MSYANRLLEAYGEDCAVMRDVPIESKTSRKRTVTSTRSYGSREAYWEGMILQSSGLKSGEILKIGEKEYLVQSVTLDPLYGCLYWFGVTVNATIAHYRYIKDVDENFNIVGQWQSVNDSLKSFVSVVTAELRKEDPGLLERTKYVFQAPKSADVKVLDRIVFNSDNYQVDSVDDVALEGVVRIQASQDIRGGD